MSSQQKEPISSSEVSEQWTTMVRELARAEGHALRRAESAGRGQSSSAGDRWTPARYWIEVQCINRPECWLPLMLPNSGTLLATAADRDEVLGRLQAPTPAAG